MENQNMLDRAAELFKAYSRKSTLYFTADGQAFWDSGLANLHAGTLKDKTVEPVEREDVTQTLKEVQLIKRSHDELSAMYAEKFGVEPPANSSDDEISSALAFGEALVDPQAEADAKAKADADAQAQADADAKAKADADAQAQADADAKGKADADAQAQAEADQKAIDDAQAKSDADAKALEDAKSKAASDSKAK